MFGRLMDIERRALVAFRGKRRYEYPRISRPILSAMDVQDIIRDKLVGDSPCMIARFGSVEIQAIVDYLYPPSFRNAIKFVKGECPSWGFAPSTVQAMHINAGFFPPKRDLLDRFGGLMIDCASYVDILGSWRREETEVMSLMPRAVLVPLYALEPYYFENPWTTALEGKKVLVVHPFKDSILRQHERYKKIFSKDSLTPSYELSVLKAVQSIAGNKPEAFNDWFEALDWMKQEISRFDFDIAIIGCGAYGFPLAAHVKSIGKKAVHLGGAVQYLFGIRSSAADENKRLKPLINDYWVYPSETERPVNHQAVENSRYW